jgi:glycosyltransferase involved in cell wall biosynthesis
MYKDKKVIVVMPAYNAAKTVRKTYHEIPLHIVDEVILVDDKSIDETIYIARELGISTIVHESNLGYGGNQKTCYKAALEKGADIVIMLHPDYQYTPKLIISMVSLIAEGLFDCVLGSRILGVGALKGGMPLYKYIANRFLTLIENLLLDYKLSEYHTGYRAFSKELLQTIPFQNNSNDFVFDNQMLAQIIYAGFNIGEISCPTHYFEEASSINFSRSVKYGFGVLGVSIAGFLHRYQIKKSSLFIPLDSLKHK